MNLIVSNQIDLAIDQFKNFLHLLIRPVSYEWGDD